jgi:hypothetical protein
MQFSTRVRTWRVARLYSEIALSRNPFGIGHMYIYTTLLRMTDTVTSQNIDLSSWDMLYIFFWCIKHVSRLRRTQLARVLDGLEYGCLYSCVVFWIFRIQIQSGDLVT